MRRSRLFLSAALLLLLLHSAASACPMCKDSLANGDAQGFGALPSGFNASIEIMLAGFFTTVSLVVGIIWKGIRG